MFVSCLKEQPAEPNLCNPRNCGDDCYIQTPSAGSTIIRRYDENSMEICLRDFTEGCTEAVTSEIDFSGSININRYRNNILDTTYSIEFDTLVVDSVSIMIDSIYYYEMTIGNESGMSQVFISDTLLFDLPPVDSIYLYQPAIDSVKLKWLYPYSEYFSKNLDMISFSLSKYDSTSNTVYDTVLDYSTSIDTFSYTDEIDLGHHIQYDIRAKFAENRYTEKTFSDTATYSFLKPDILDWFPLNSQSIYMHWSFPEDFVELLDYIEIQIPCNPTVSIPIEPVDTTSFVFYPGLECNDDLAGLINIEYENKFLWCAGPVCDSSSVMVKTFPLHNMQYIPGISEYLVFWDSSIVSIDPFYIDLYERFNLVEDNSYNISDDFPITNISIEEAREYAQSLTNGGYLNLCDNCGFRLPTEIEWEYVARDCRSNLYENINCDKLYEYPMQVAASISCEYANYAGAGCDENPDVKSVGFYDGTIFPFELATSPAGLYDMSGNIAEWVEQNRFQDKYICRGGSYKDDENFIKTTSYKIYNSSDITLETIGFRIVISADEAIQALKGSLE